MISENNKEYVHKDFRKIFYLNEGREILGKNNRNLWALMSILFLTFTAIGFASGSLIYLKKKMDDPYINWVNVNIPYGMGSEGAIIQDRLNRDSVAKKEYHFNNVTAYYRFPIAFYSKKAKGTIEVIGRTINVNDPIINEIFKPNNKIYGRSFNDENDIGIIVTKEFLDRFGYDKNAAVINMSVALGDNNQEFVPIPIIAVLKELPGMTMFATTPYFRQLKKEPAKGNPFRRDGTDEIVVFIPGDTAKGNLLKQNMSDYFNTHSEYEDYSPWITITSNDQSYQKGFNVSVSLIGDLLVKDFDDIYLKMIQSEEFRSVKDDIIRFYNYKTYQIYQYSNYDFLAINFNNLTKVREFKKYFSEIYKLRIDIAQIEAKENYSYVSKLTLIISFILIIFSVLVISMFISNLLSRHLDKVKSNIGTFKAFGLSNKDLLGIYITLSMWFIGVAMIGAFILSLIFGEMGGVRLGLTLVNATIEPNEKYFHLFNSWLLISTLLVIMVSVLVIYDTANRILKRTPGDLIYNRD